MVNVTDLHIRGTPVTRLIDVAPLSDFNLLARTRRRTIRELEMLTLVISSAGALTDSHTDDSDGSNHCFAGRKLWLIWDSATGMARGLEDVERCDVYDRAAFDIETFLSLPTARWFILAKGQTLFLPGNYAHKVITLDHYLGVGSFFVMLPSYLRRLIQWKRLAPLWSVSDSNRARGRLLDDVTNVVTRCVQSLAFASTKERRRWGLTYLMRAVRDWDARCFAAEEQLLSECRSSAALLEAVRRLRCRLK